MITKEQEEFLSTLSDKAISIVPYDPRTERLYGSIKERILKVLGPEAVVEHCGASSFGISGQDEIDVTIVANKAMFADYIPKLEKEFGPMKSQYPDRVRFKTEVEGKKIDLKISDEDHPNHIRGKIFEAYLWKHPEELERYRILKEESNGVTVKEYYRRKIEFINDILSRAS